MLIGSPLEDDSAKRGVFSLLAIHSGIISESDDLPVAGALDLLRINDDDAIDILVRPGCSKSRDVQATERRTVPIVTAIKFIGDKIIALMSDPCNDVSAGVHVDKNKWFVAQVGMHDL
jgi:hypothetical protein